MKLRYEARKIIALREQHWPLFKISHNFNTKKCDFSIMHCRSELEVTWSNCSVAPVADFETIYSFIYFPPCFVNLTSLIYESTLTVRMLNVLNLRALQLIGFIFTLRAFIGNFASYFSEYSIISGLHELLAKDDYHWKVKLIFRERINC